MMIPVAISASTWDDSAACQINEVRSNEHPAKPGIVDWIVTGPLTVDLRGESSQGHNGRTYTITVRCTNATNLSATGEVTLTVPRDRKK